jgi:hypothetical protein
MQPQDIRIEFLARMAVRNYDNLSRLGDGHLEELARHSPEIAIFLRQLAFEVEENVPRLLRERRAARRLSLLS